ncbi:hypothetical protein NFI96_029410 [Prochilodus magdalenae]|nr:hypothetical protein NFI96_029410 [Prochilodus magdalenae]
MMFLCSLSLFIIMIESCVSQSISPLEEKVDAVEGETVTLSCRYSGSPYLYWYRQYPGSRPEFLLRIYPSTKEVLYATPPFPRLDVKLDGNKLDLEISSAAVSDSVLYYCARGPTVTRSPSTLYKNSLTDKALSINAALLWFVYVFTESCVSQSISPLEEKVDAVEGETVTLSCRYEDSATPNNLQWYLQYPGSIPEYLLMILPASEIVTHATPRFPRLDAEVDVKNKCVDLKISSAAVSDSVLYYCALRPTVTGNPDTLYRNCSSDKQFPMSRPEFLLYIHPHEHRRASPLPHLSTEVVENCVDLEISSAAVSDSVLYYCALRPTVTGNPDTLYRTSLSVFITELLTLVQILHWRSSCRHFQYPEYFLP